MPVPSVSKEEYNNLSLKKGGGVQEKLVGNICGSVNNNAINGLILTKDLLLILKKIVRIYLCGVSKHVAGVTSVAGGVRLVWLNKGATPLYIVAAQEGHVGGR